MYAIFFGKTPIISQNSITFWCIYYCCLQVSIMSTRLSTIKLVSQFAKFCGVGSINTIISLVAIYIGSEKIGAHYITANITGYTIGVGLGYILHKTLTFQDKTKLSQKQFLQFLTVFLISYILQLCILATLINTLEIDDFLAQIIAAGFFTIFNFLGNRIFTFQSKKETIL